MARGSKASPPAKSWTRAAGPGVAAAADAPGEQGAHRQGQAAQGDGADGQGIETIQVQALAHDRDDAGEGQDQAGNGPAAQTFGEENGGEQDGDQGGGAHRMAVRAAGTRASPV